MTRDFVEIVKATLTDAAEVHRMQVVSFKELLDRYQDFELSPGAESVERIVSRMKQENSHYYLIRFMGDLAGAVRIQTNNTEQTCRVSPIFVLPQFRNQGISRKVFQIIEEIYRPNNGWRLDTILEETWLCIFYEKIGYTKTGKVDFIKDGMHIVYFQKRS